MAERKTAEIKFRIEPSRKARFQQAAADEGIGLSEFLVLAAEDRAAEIAAPSSNPFADIPSVATSDAAPTKCGDGAVQEGKWFSPEFKPWESR